MFQMSMNVQKALMNVIITVTTQMDLIHVVVMEDTLYTLMVLHV